ncbi:hypothetical protein H072_6339 [Dactylellina haptotyla CBS 200.50]|uniref:Uncharacterized protein n=1 Tax=Dactylellina haptotyla (strain CBS 200.50) TaxID=1284197 RepID=S8BWS9_DACHA|nr:hypothetical protein H072_6339 [Dactylellina haptotyla CBS 200.50]
MPLPRGLPAILSKHPTDIIIASALRTPITRSIKGGLAATHPEELLSSVLSATLKRTKVPPSEVKDVLVGAVLQTLGGQKASAAAVKNVGFPSSTTVATVNRQCSSSAYAMTILANALRVNTESGVGGGLDCAIAAGTESMSLDYFPHRGIPWRVADGVGKGSKVQEARDVLMPMGITSENVARELGISREEQDRFAMNSHRKAGEAWEKGWFEDEVVEVSARKVVTEGAGEDTKVVETGWEIIKRDDGLRKGLSMEKLAALKPAFTADGTTTAGNSSQISDGAAAVLLMTRAKAEALGIKPIGKYIHGTVMGVAPRVMGIAPAIAVPELLRLTGVDKSEVDVWELNEAFGSQSVYCIRELGIDPEKVNPMGGAIALGHPLGATGARIVATLLNGLQKTNGRLGVLSMCASTGQGYAGMLVRED